MRGGRFRLRRIGNVRFFSWRTRFDASAALETCTGNINTLAIVGIAATGLCAKTLELIAPDATGDFMSDGGGEDRHNQSSAGGSRPIKRRMPVSAQRLAG
jgi:hypothetical protein